MIRETLSDKVLFQQTLGKSQGVNHVANGEECSMEGEKQVKRSRCRSGPSVYLGTTRRPVFPCASS